MEEDNPGMKRCNRCLIYKSLDSFSKTKRTNDTKQYYCKPCFKEIRKSYRSRNNQKLKDDQRYYSYRITPLEYTNKLVEQNGVCAICKNPETVILGNTVKQLSVDHSHIANKNRGLLCQRCNAAIGLMKEDSNILQSAIEYLDLWKKKYLEL